MNNTTNSHVDIKISNKFIYYFIYDYKNFIYPVEKTILLKKLWNKKGVLNINSILKYIIKKEDIKKIGTLNTKIIIKNSIHEIIIPCVENLDIEIVSPSKFFNKKKKIKIKFSKLNYNFQNFKLYIDKKLKNIIDIQILFKYLYSFKYIENLDLKLFNKNILDISKLKLNKNLKTLMLDNTRIFVSKKKDIQFFNKLGLFFKNTNVVNEFVKLANFIEISSNKKFIKIPTVLEGKKIFDNTNLLSIQNTKFYTKKNVLIKNFNTLIWNNKYYNGIIKLENVEKLEIFQPQLFFLTDDKLKEIHIKNINIEILKQIKNLKSNTEIVLFPSIFPKTNNFKLFMKFIEEILKMKIKNNIFIDETSLDANEIQILLEKKFDSIDNQLLIKFFKYINKYGLSKEKILEFYVNEYIFYNKKIKNIYIPNFVLIHPVYKKIKRKIFSSVGQI